MVTKSNPRVRNFLIVGMALGFGIIALGEVGDIGFQVDVALTGFELSGCPAGTIPQNNICVQFVPSLQATGAPTNFLTVAGLGILLVSFGGFVFRGIYRRGF